jgi:hypothetical protein
MAVPVEEAIAALSTFSLEVLIINNNNNNKSSFYFSPKLYDVVYI